jgi:hypothetical protein
MTAEDQACLKRREFDREAWAELWDSLPERLRRSALTFVLNELHAIESGGTFSVAWHYETSEQREESGAPIYDTDQPGDVVTFKGRIQYGSAGSTPF